jgi:hypothetical protein
MKETRIYETYDGWEKKVVLWHGASETFVLSSDVRINDSFKFFRRWKPYKEEKEINSWLSDVLQRAKDNGDLK